MGEQREEWCIESLAHLVHGVNHCVELPPHLVMPVSDDVKLNSDFTVLVRARDEGPKHRLAVVLK